MRCQYIMSTVYDVVVVGAGVEGSATAYHLAKQGKKTLLLEQFPLSHSRGSSHGHSRITRMGYQEEFYVRMMQEAYRLWDDLERETGIAMYKKTGLLTMAKRGNEIIYQVQTSLEKVGERPLKLSACQLKEKYPMLSYSNDYEAVYDGTGGILWADKALSGYQTMFTRFGGEIRSGEKMQSLSPGTIVTVTTTNGVYKTRNVVITVGPWAPKVLKPLGLNLPLQPRRVTVCYWKEKQEGVYTPENGFPCFIDEELVGRAYVYGIPTGEYPGHVKICIHSGPSTDPDNRDEVYEKWVIDEVAPYVRAHFPGLDGTRPSIIETCMYTTTPDKNPVLDTHPHWKNIVIGAGFSGHGFKLSPVVGKVLSELATGKKPSHDLTPFSINRFVSKSSL